MSSFDASVLAIARQVVPQLPLGLITWGTFPLRKAIPAAVHLGAEVAMVNVGSFGLRSPGIAALEREPAVTLEVAHRAGLQVGVWGAGVDDARTLARAGVDCLVVDDDVLAAGLDE